MLKNVLEAFLHQTNPCLLIGPLPEAAEPAAGKALQEAKLNNKEVPSKGYRLGLNGLVVTLLTLTKLTGVRISRGTQAPRNYFF